MAALQLRKAAKDDGFIKGLVLISP